MATSFITLFLGSTIGGLKSEENLAMQTPVFIRQLVIVLTIFFFFSYPPPTRKVSSLTVTMHLSAEPTTLVRVTIGGWIGELLVMIKI